MGEQLWRFRKSTGHQGPLTPGHKNYNGCPFNVQVEWESGETTYEPLNKAAQDAAVECTIYAKENTLLDTPGWKRFRNIAKHEQRMFQELNQSKLCQVRRTTKYKYVFAMPKSYKEAIDPDTLNGNHKWRDSTKLELDSTDKYKTFSDKGKAIYNNGTIANSPV